jgi:hypothetical protein
VEQFDLAIGAGTIESLMEEIRMTVMTPTPDVPDEPFDAAQDAWTRAFCRTWNGLVNDTADLVDLADWADALYPTHGHQDPCEVARDVFKESERCG